MNAQSTRGMMNRFGMAAVIAALSGSALAAEPQTGSQNDADLLRGPKVVESSGPDAGDSMTGSGEASRKAGDMPLRSYLGAIRGLQKASKEHPELTLSDEQKEQIKAIAQAHQEKMKAFMEEHRAELDELRGERGERGTRGDRKGERGAQRAGRKAPPPPDRDDLDDEMMEDAEHADRPGASPEERQAMREKMADLMATAPSDQEAKKAIWGVLTSEQQEAVKAEVERMRVQRESRVDMAMGRDRKNANEDRGEEAKKERRGKRDSDGKRLKRRGDD